jgi:spore maturation protein CgeB
MTDATRRRAVPLPSGMKELLRRWPAARAAWTSYRAAQVLREYRRRREHYAAIAAERNIVYREEEIAADVRRRLAARGYTPAVRRRGEVHTVACFPSYGWHRHLLPDLRELGPVSHFDYTALGYAAEEFTRCDERSIARRGEMSRHIVPFVRAAHAERPVDWVFWYGGGQDTSPDVVRRIVEELGVPVVNLSLDDKQGWAGATASGWRAGAVDLTAVFDLFATSARVACEWHMIEGGRPLYLPEGFDAAAYAPREGERDLGVSFVGAAYGFRMSVVEELHAHGIDVAAFGDGWPAGRADDIVAVFNRSRINLGMGGIEYSEDLTNVKGRDFEIPGTGGGMYLTSFNPDLALHFDVGSEIVCYRNRDEMIELIRHYLARPEEAEAVARRARARCLREHRWLHRYETMLQVLGVLAP